MTQAVLNHHSQREAEKFLAEVFWRTYWKGWMELRPSVWRMYVNDLNALHNGLQTQSGLRNRWEEACLGQTGIACFDTWSQELVDTGYLHNHARMWFASIWVFTLELPWQLGADFFLRHLLDGDAAVNTLSWRWVAGIQTPGKTYLATAENIAKFTDGRFSDTSGLARIAIPPDAAPNPLPGDIPPIVSPHPTGRYGVLLHSDDIDLEFMQTHAPNPLVIAYLDTTADQSPWMMAPMVTRFRKDAAIYEAGGMALEIVESAEELNEWANRHELEQIITPYAPVGFTQDMFRSHQHNPQTVPLIQYRRALETAAWPLATKGFFPFKKHIPKLISDFT